MKVGTVGAVTFIITWSETEGQGPDAVNVKVTLPELIVGVYTGVKLDIFENEPEGAVQEIAFAEPP